MNRRDEILESGDNDDGSDEEEERVVLVENLGQW